MRLNLRELRVFFLQLGGGVEGGGAEGGGGCLRKQQTKCSDLSAVMAHNNRVGQLQRTIVKQ